MKNGKDIHEGFTPELQKEGEDLDFAYQEVQKGIKKGGLTAEDAGFAYYLASSGHEPEDMEDEDLDGLRESYEENFFFQQKVRLEDGQNVHFGFTPELIKSGRNFGFTLQQTQEGINAGMSINDAGLCAGLESHKGMNPEGVLNFGNYQQLRNEYQQCHSLITQQIQSS